ncbi:MAG TPA: hypothetical protein VGE39_00455 [Prosthecobacter sp.]
MSHETRAIADTLQSEFDTRFHLLTGDLTSAEKAEVLQDICTRLGGQIEAHLDAEG